MCQFVVIYLYVPYAPIYAVWLRVGITHQLCDQAESTCIAQGETQAYGTMYSMYDVQRRYFTK
jgi:hypothetical protein